MAIRQLKMVLFLLKSQSYIRKSIAAVVVGWEFSPLISAILCVMGLGIAQIVSNYDVFNNIVYNSGYGVSLAEKLVQRFIKPLLCGFGELY